MEENTIDLGSVKVPSSWNDLTLLQFSKIEEYYSNQEEERKFNVLDVIDILIDKDKDYIMALPSEFLDIILEKLQFLQTAPNYGEPSNKLIINGEEYIVNVQNKLRTGEFIAVDTIMKNDKHNYAAMLAILCRKQSEAYDSKFENEVLEKRIEMFEKIPMMDAMRVITFFLTLWLTLNQVTLLSSEVEEAINHIQKHIEISRKSGDLSLWSMICLKRKLKKLRKSIPHI